ncbi:MAG: electron transfer flavoprotein subunit alpha/FixB family protein [Clostridiales bacterium]
MKKENNHDDKYYHVWILVDYNLGVISSVTYELLGVGRYLADKLGVKLGAVGLGFNIENKTIDLIKYGADIVYIIDDKNYEKFNDEIYSESYFRLIEMYKPEIILIGATIYGRSMAPKIASMLNTGLTADCTGLDIDLETKNLIQIRPAFGGNLMATIICPYKRPQIATVRPKVMKAKKVDTSRKGKVIKPKINININSKLVIIDCVKTLSEVVNLSEAEVIVSVGRGIEKKENLILIEELAKVLGAAIGASRAVVDSGWIGYEHQIGQTGITVSPKLYIACGISGAVQHLIGMSSANKIVAINKDPEAEIFQIADIGIVGDINEFIPELIRIYKA